MSKTGKARNLLFDAEQRLELAIIDIEAARFQLEQLGLERVGLVRALDLQEAAIRRRIIALRSVREQI